MKTRIYILSIRLLVFFIISCQSSFGQDILQSKVNSDAIDQIVNNIDVWRASKRKQWAEDLQKLPDTVKAKIIQNGEDYLSYEWPSHKAMDFLDYKLNGNRTVYESVINKRREVFEKLVKAELIESKGRFIPDIINGLWLILEESTWVSPAHLASQKLGVGLANIEDMYIDLGAGRQAVSVALTYFMLNDEFDKYSKQINMRVLHELRRRITDAYLERTDYWWMSFNTNFVNNWNIWINTNVLKTFLLIETDKAKLQKGLHKVMSSADKFINSYPEDGACDEGPSYWMHAGGELGSMLKWIEDVAQGKVSFVGDKKLENIGAYIINAHIAENRYINFADALAIENVSPLKVWNFYQISKNENFGGFASYLAHRPDFIYQNQVLHDLLELSSSQAELFDYTTNYSAPEYSFYKSLGQVLVKNTVAENTLFFSAIGSHNDVSHNHNDVGSYMVYYNGYPVLIDIGVGTYNSKTFSSKRYEIWNMQSQYHNLPLINGIQQKEGRKFEATDVKTSKSTTHYTYSVDIAKAYPNDAAVTSWVRDFKLTKKSNVLEVKEKYILKDSKATQQLVFMTKYKPNIKNNSFNITLNDKDQAILEFKTKTKDIRVEEIVVEDVRIAKVWGEKVYRVIAEFDTKSKTGLIEYNLRFSK
jgi:hypothetical protein